MMRVEIVNGVQDEPLDGEFVVFDTETDRTERRNGTDDRNRSSTYPRRLKS